VSIALIANTRAIFWRLKYTVSDAILTLLYTAVEIYCLYVVGSLYGQLKGESSKESDEREREKEQPYIISIDDFGMNENIV
jgi:hypothetical protein